MGIDFDVHYVVCQSEMFRWDPYFSTGRHFFNLSNHRLHDSRASFSREFWSSFSGSGGGFVRTFVASRRCASIRLIVGKTVKVCCLLVYDVPNSAKYWL